MNRSHRSPAKRPLALLLALTLLLTLLQGLPQAAHATDPVNQAAATATAANNASYQHLTPVPAANPIEPVSGMPCWSIAPGKIIGWELSDDFLTGFDGCATIEVTYYDYANGRIMLCYDGEAGNALYHPTVIACTNPQVPLNQLPLKVAKFPIGDAVFENCRNGGFSFALGAFYRNASGATAQSPNTVYVKSVTVTKTGDTALEVALTSASDQENLVFFDQEPFDISLSVKNTGAAKNLKVLCSLTAPNGTPLITDYALYNGQVPGSMTAPHTLLTAQQLSAYATGYGTFRLDLRIVDNATGNIVKNDSFCFHRAMTEAISTSLVSAGNAGSDLVFSNNTPYDLSVNVSKLDGLADTLTIQYSVTKQGSSAPFTSGFWTREVASSGATQIPLTLTNTGETGIFTLSLKITDSMGVVRNFSHTFSREADYQMTLQSQSNKRGFIFSNSEAYDFKLFLQKNDGIAEAVNVAITVTDSGAQVVKQIVNTVSLPATGYFQTALDLSSVTGYGVFVMDVTVTNSEGDTVMSASYPFSRVLATAAAGSADIVGVNMHFSNTSANLQTLLDLSAKTGASMWRSSIPWITVEQQKGVLNIPQLTDTVVDYTLSLGMEPLVILAYGNALYGSDVTTDAWLAGYVNYCRTVALHFKDRVTHYEIWNEWNIALGGLDQQFKDDPQLYARALVAASNAIHEVDPDATIIGGVTAGLPLSWIEEMLQYDWDGDGVYDTMDAIDAFSFHLYPMMRNPESQEEILLISPEAHNNPGFFADIAALLNEYGSNDTKEIWLTETGWPTHLDGTSEYRAISETLSAAYMLRSYTWAMANPQLIDKMLWYDLMNDGISAFEPEDNFGLLRSYSADEPVPYAAKKSYVAMCAMNSLLADAQYVSTYDLGSGVYAYRFQKDGQDLLVAWMDGASQALNASFSGDLTVTDMYGNATTYTGTAQLNLSDCPIYIQGDLSGLSVN